MKPEIGPIIHFPIKDLKNIPTLQEADPNILTFRVGEKTIPAPIKEFYTFKDIALASDIGFSTCVDRISRLRKNNPTIEENLIRAMQGKKRYLFDQKGFIELVTSILMIPDGRKTRKKQPPTLSQLIPADSSKPRVETSIFEENLQDPEKQIMKGKQPIDIKELKIQILRKSALYMLSNLTENTNRNVRVILGQFLPQNTTLPDVFGYIPDAKLKNDLMYFTGYNLQTFWGKKPSDIDKSASEEERQEEEQFIAVCQDLRQKGHYPERIVDDIDKKIIAHPPYREI